MPVVGGLYAVRRRALWGLETTEQELLERFTAGINAPIPPRVVTDGPCKEVILTGDDADFGQLPICVHSRDDIGPFITMGLQIARRPDYGTNVCIVRMQIFDGKTAGVNNQAPGNLATYFAAAEARGEPLGVAVAIGNDPYVSLTSQWRGSIYTDEIAIAGGVMGEPIEVVRCETIDVLVPATSEIVLEGEMVPGKRRVEGPFGEAPGYYNRASDKPIFRLRAITHRRNPIYLAGLTGKPTTDNHIMKQIALEPMLFKAMREICPTVRDVCVTPASHSLHFIISMRPRFATDARDVMLAALSSGLHPKRVTVVDEDVDVRDPEQVEWASTFRVVADRDVVILPRVSGYALDPSTPKRVGAAMGVDATKPFDEDYGAITVVPGAEEFVIPGWTDLAGVPVDPSQRIATGSRAY
jgi:4-hydroxy-3-polyprenylbenzoate decarboxylase/2,5-furandicarboxylate decarboxylase 1